MASEGPLSPTAFASEEAGGSGTNAWSNASNAGASDGSYATATASTHYLKTTGYGFAIPSDATIDGIVVEVEGSASTLAGTEVRLYKAGSLVGLGTSLSWTSTETYRTYGSSIDKFGTTWTPSDINNAGFGAGVWGWQYAGSTRSVDHVRITVYYTEASAPFRRSLLGVGF